MEAILSDEEVWFPSCERHNCKHILLLGGFDQFCINLQICVHIPDCLCAGMADFSWRGQIENILGFIDPRVSTATT